eukprot:TRINITY_DN60301_c0_g1_i1.p1 TRINITY_DN60301_c0_g1~~TRINITY_DN60301_c0_g1_i1.p1  ORF type:complete len:501 (+),score=105.74 TRINITY_DN60301_c0_g1_i1:42-1544(+)
MGATMGLSQSSNALTTSVCVRVRESKNGDAMGRSSTSRADTGDATLDDLLGKLQEAAQDVHLHCQSLAKAGDSANSAEEYFLKAEKRLRRIGQQVTKIPQLARERREGKQCAYAARERAETLHLFCNIRPVPRFRDVARQVLLQVKALRRWRSGMKPNRAVGPRKTIVESLRLDVLQWDSIDVFKLEATSVKSLVYVVNGISTQISLSEIISCPLDKVSNYMEALGNTYVNENPYHNRMHAAEVTVATHFLWTSIAVGLPDFATKVDIWMAVLAAAMHDVGHPGVNSDFLVKTSDVLALRYNDHSVLENFHAASGFELMRTLKLDLLAHTFDSPPAISLRKRVIDMILITDMSRHKECLANVTKELEVHTARDVDKLALEQLIVHTADIGHPLRPNAAHIEWSKRVSEEFFAQGDREKKLGFVPMSLLDREKSPSLAKGQVGFLNFLVLPTWKLLCQVAPKLAETPPGVCLSKNLSYWQALVAEEEQAEQAKPVAEAKQG